MWGEELTKEEDVSHVFECYLTGEKNKNGVKVSKSSKFHWSVDNTKYVMKGYLQHNFTCKKHSLSMMSQDDKA